MRPPLVLRRVANPILMRLGVSGTRALAVRKRRSGTIQRIPIIPVEHQGERYLVAPRGETDWVRNLRAAGGVAELGRWGRLRPIQATELPPDARADVISSYRAIAGRAVRSFFEAMPDPADHPVFRIEDRPA